MEPIFGHFRSFLLVFERFRTEKIVPVHRVSFWKGVLRDYLLRRRWVLKFLGKKRKKQLLRNLFSDPLPEGHPVDGQFFLSYVFGQFWPKTAKERLEVGSSGRSFPGHLPGDPGRAREGSVAGSQVTILEA